MSCTSKNFREYFALALAALSSLVTLIGLIFQSNIEFNDVPLYLKIGIFLLVLLICFFYAWSMTRQKSKVIFQINQQFTLTIEKGNLFTKKGIIVIPVNEYFDTHVGDGIISPNSIHGKFINLLDGDRVAKLDSKLETKLKKEKSHNNKRRLQGKNLKYELGTCVDIEIDDNVYVLVALTHFDKNDHAYLERKEYAEVLDKLFSHLSSDIRIEAPIYMPLMGTGLSRLKRHPQCILNYLLDTIDFSHSKKTFPYGVHVEIYNIDQVNLNQLEEHYYNGLTL